MDIAVFVCEGAENVWNDYKNILSPLLGEKNIYHVFNMVSSMEYYLYEDDYDYFVRVSKNGLFIKGLNDYECGGLTLWKCPNLLFIEGPEFYKNVSIRLDESGNLILKYKTYNEIVDYVKLKC